MNTEVHVYDCETFVVLYIEDVSGLSCSFQTFAS